MLQPKATKDADSYVECATWTGYTTWPQAAQIGRITRAGCAARAGCVTRASMHATLPAFTHALLTMPAHTAPHDTRAADRIQGIVPYQPSPVSHGAHARPNPQTGIPRHAISRYNAHELTAAATDGARRFARTERDVPHGQFSGTPVGCGRPRRAATGCSKRQNDRTRGSAWRRNWDLA